jgi:hypothetical protein
MMKESGWIGRIENKKLQRKTARSNHRTIQNKIFMVNPKCLIGLLWMLTGAFVAEGAQPNHRATYEFAVDGTDYQLVGTQYSIGDLMGVYGDGKLLFVTNPYEPIQLWRASEYTAFRAQPYDSHWLNKFLRDLRKKSIHQALYPPVKNPHQHISTPILPGMLLAPVLLPITLPFEYAHDARENAFWSAWDKLRIGTDSKKVLEMLGKPQAVSSNPPSTYEVMYFRDNTGAGIADGKLVWKATGYAPNDYGTGTYTRR